MVLVNHTNFDHLLTLYWPPVVARPLHRGLASLNRWLIRPASAVAAFNAEAMKEALALGADPVRVIGTPVAADFLRTRRACPNIEFHGWLSRARVLQEIDRADALVLPSSWPVTLLVVPWRSWTRDGLRTLRSWLIFRDVAEHLALSSEQIVRLMGRCGSWFGEQGLGVPSLYVPPAWALGPVDHKRLRNVAFASVEVLGGLISTREGSLRRLPLVGFEADTRFRAAALRGGNRLHRRLASSGTRPLRIAIHAHDHRLRLRDDL